MSQIKPGDRLRLSYFRHDTSEGFPRTLTYSRFGTCIERHQEGVLVYPDSESLYVPSEFWPFETTNPRYSRIVIEAVEEA